MTFRRFSSMSATTSCISSSSVGSGRGAAATAGKHLLQSRPGSVTVDKGQRAKFDGTPCVASRWPVSGTVVTVPDPPNLREKTDAQSERAYRQP